MQPIISSDISDTIEGKIYLIHGHKVMLDSDLAELYGVEVKQLKRQVKRNIDRFPADFMFQLLKNEYDSLRSHFGTLKRGAHGEKLWVNAKEGKMLNRGDAETQRRRVKTS